MVLIYKSLDTDLFRIQNNLDHWISLVDWQPRLKH
nr:hypothetical protein CJLB15_00045 [Campylobacter phage CJLB-15]